MRNFHKFILTLLTLILVFGTSVATAQDNEPTKKATAFDQYFYINGNFGIATFHGDIVAKTNFLKEPKFGFGLNLGYQFAPVLGARLNMTSGKLKSTQDNLSFDGGFTDLSAQLTVDITNLLSKNNNAKSNLYGFGGFGILMYNGNSIVPMPPGNTPFATGDFNGTVMVFPAGIGFKYALNENLDITAEGSFHYSSSDKLEEANAKDFGLKEPFYKMDAAKFLSLGLSYNLTSETTAGIIGGSGAGKMIRNHETVIYEVTPKVLQEKGGKVPYEISVTFPENYFGAGAAVELAPILIYGDQKLTLAKQTFVGEKVVGVEGQMVPYKTGGVYTFSGEFDFTLEMASSEMVMTPIVYDPKKGDEALLNKLSETQVKIADGIIHTEDFAGGNETSLLAASGYKLETIASEKSILYFPHNKFSYNKRTGLNKTKKATDARVDVNEFLAQGWDIKNITVNAYASPEGEQTLNANLSENRAKVADRQIRGQLRKLINAKNSKIDLDNLSGVNFTVVGNGPDWDGFMAALETSNVADKSTILNVIKSASPSSKETEIKNMILMYPELENILSPLRRAEIIVNCSEPKRTAEVIAALATTNPQELTIQELLYAATLTMDEKAQAAIYKTAASLYTSSWEALANNAYMEILNGNYTDALTYLGKANELAPNNATILNNMGVIHAKQGAWDKAKKCFTNAQNLGTNENYNLGVVAIQFGEYDKALKLFGSRKCDVNVGLAQLMTANYEDAKANLSCAKETCKTNYLLAIVGARTANDADVFASLKKAFDINPKLKGKALNDREFVKYFENEKFLTLMK